MDRPGRRGGPPSDAILTVPNLLTFFRLALVPVFLWLALGPQRIDLALLVAVGGFATDLIDGVIARRWGQVSRLGTALDPLADRLGLAAGAVVFIVHDLAPLWIVVAVAVRDALLVLVGAPILRSKGIPIPPVSTVGKMGSFAVSVSFALYLAAGWPGPADPIEAVQTAGLVVAVIGLPLYYIAGAGYAGAALRASQRSPSPGAPPG